MTPIDRTELRRLSTAATPGPWTIHTEEVCSPIVAAMELSKLVHGSVFVPVLPMVVGSNGLATAVTGCGPTSVANAAYIAAASPDVVLALLDSIRRADELEAQQSETIVHQAGEIARLLADLDALRVRLAEVEKDAARGRFMIDNGCWHRGDEQTHLAVLVPQGSDLSCYAMREAAIDAAMKEQA